MRRVLRREAAKRDLIEQYVWYAENASVAVADRFLRAVENTLSLLAEAPATGSPVWVERDELRGLRRWPVKDFEKTLLFYRSDESSIDLIRVLHGSRDILHLLDDAPPR